MGLLISPLDNALGSTSKVRLLRLLLEQNRTVSGREAARLTGMSQTAIRRAIKELSLSGLIHQESAGVQFLCSANRDHLLIAEILGPLFAAEARWPATLFSRIRDIVSIIEHDSSLKRSDEQFAVLAVWIFGSVAKGTDKPGSDFDIMFLARNEHTANCVSDGVATYLWDLSRELGTDVRPVILTLAQARHQLQEHDYFIMGALRNARVIIGEIPAELRIGKEDEVKANR